MPATTSWIELNAGAFAHNVATMKSVVQTKVAAVLKGNAYGHGFREVLQILHPQVDALVVVRPDEAIDIRGFEARHSYPAQRVVVVGAASAEDCVELARHGVEVAVGSGNFASVAPTLRAAHAQLKVLLNLETGMGRDGFDAAQLAAGDADFFADSDVFKVTGLMSHMAYADDASAPEYAQFQLEQFARACELARARLKLPQLPRQLASSAAALVVPAARFDTVRVGVALYGMFPSPASRTSVAGTGIHLRPALTWKVDSYLLRWLPAGAYVGYGCTFRCSARTRTAVLPVGYADGYPRLASGRAHVLVNGKRCAVLGLVMMNHLVVDVTHATTPDSQSVTATLIGVDGGEHITADQMAIWSATINYEVVARLAPHLPRHIVETKAGATA